MPLISVIVPVYNLEKEISKCILSILLQKFSDFEIIAIDDGSTDNSLSILTELSKKWSDKLRVFQSTAKHNSCSQQEPPLRNPRLRV